MSENPLEDVLNAADNGAGTPEEIRERLADMLGLGDVGRTIVGAELFGRGPAASVDLRLSGDLKITFERFGDVSKPAALTAHLMSSVGVAKVFKAPDAAIVGALIFQLARHHGEHTEDEAAREWGCEFLRLANWRDVDLADQEDRWRAFSVIAVLNPPHDAGEDRSGHSLACASTVLADKSSGVRLVRCGWFLGYVRREGGTYSPASLGTQMARVGWERRGGEGRVKATCPGDRRRTLNWRFYTVPKGWEE